jgi:hypothetical protein
MNAEFQMGCVTDSSQRSSRLCVEVAVRMHLNHPIYPLGWKHGIISWIILWWCVAGNLVASDTPNFPPPLSIGDTNLMGHGVQRTMNLLATSKPDHKNKVRILFYGQSITEQSWWRMVADDIRRRFPDADLTIENRAIGGHAAQLLVKTAEADLYPFYPDLLVFHVYGSHLEYEHLIQLVRERTTAEIIIQTDHVTRDENLSEETDPKKLTPKNWDAFMNNLFLPESAKKYGAELADVRTGWKQYLRDYHLPAESLLKDGVHLNEQGCFLMAELLKPWLRLNPAVDDRAWTNSVRTFTLGPDLRPQEGRLKLEFIGNRVEAIAAEQLAEKDSLEVWLDGQRPSAIPELRVFTRVSAFPNSTWPCLLRIDSGAPLEVEDWTLVLNEVTEDLARVKFSLRGSVTGEDGVGSSDVRFVSTSHRIVIHPEDWNLKYCQQVFKRSLAPGFQIHWKVVPMYQDEFRPKPTTSPGVENVITLAQGLSNGRHSLELRGQGFTNLAALRVYHPPGMPPRN